MVTRRIVPFGEGVVRKNFGAQLRNEDSSQFSDRGEIRESFRCLRMIIKRPLLPFLFPPRKRLIRVPLPPYSSERERKGPPPRWEIE